MDPKSRKRHAMRTRDAHKKSQKTNVVHGRLYNLPPEPQHPINAYIEHANSEYSRKINPPKIERIPIFSSPSPVLAPPSFNGVTSRSAPSLFLDECIQSYSPVSDPVPDSPFFLEMIDSPVVIAQEKVEVPERQGLISYVSSFFW